MATNFTPQSTVMSMSMPILNVGFAFIKALKGKCLKCVRIDLLAADLKRLERI